AAQRGSLDATLLDAFSSSDLRQQSLRRAVPAIARRDPARARALLDEYVDDTAVRQEIEAQTGLAAPRERASLRAATARVARDVPVVRARHSPLSTIRTAQAQRPPSPPTPRFRARG